MQIMCVLTGRPSLKLPPDILQFLPVKEKSLLMLVVRRAFGAFLRWKANLQFSENTKLKQCDEEKDSIQCRTMSEHITGKSLLFNLPGF